MRTVWKIDSFGVVSIIGAGAWGTAVAALIAENHPGLCVRLWAYEKSVAHTINKRSENTLYLPGTVLPSNVSATYSLRECFQNARIVIIATPSKAVYDTCQRCAAHILPDAHVAFLSKGFCKIQGKTLTISETIALALPRVGNRIAAISGPTHAEEVTTRFHSCISIGSANEETRRVFTRLLSCSFLQCRETDDIRGVELGGTLKNPAAIAAGMISVLPKCGDNLAGALIAESMKEMLRVGTALGGREETLLDISGLGDLVATALSSHSRNRRFGSDIAGRIIKGGRPLGLFDRILLYFRPGRVMERMTQRLHYLAEGAYAIEPLIEIAERVGVALPLYRSLYEVLLNRKDPSLLVETIKDPRRFEELYARAGFQPFLSGRDVRHQAGTLFKKPVLDDLVRKIDTAGVPGICGDTADARAAIIEKASAVFDHIADRFSRVFAAVAFFLLNILSLISPLAGARGLPVAVLRVEGGGIRRSREMSGFTPVYVMPLDDRAMVPQAVFAIRRRGMPPPRFWTDEVPIRGPFMDGILRRCGGFSAGYARIGDPLYREVLASYLSFMASHGIPVLLLSPPRENSGVLGNSYNDEAAFLLQSILDTRQPLLFFPVSAYPAEARAGRGGVRLRIGEPLSSSAAPDAGPLLVEIARRITGSGAINRKR
ncbi:MAG TPA: NAD(P)H-dependent glycerol-3-phosphate dehydrogenase [Spirochaetota bacterium]|nr:NAD(P)H-dependent glycerol-3-phosphate dehydrogenase [Spirochaetota bacterium]